MRLDTRCMRRRRELLACRFAWWERPEGATRRLLLMPHCESDVFELGPRRDLTPAHVVPMHHVSSSSRVRRLLVVLRSRQRQVSGFWPKRLGERDAAALSIGAGLHVRGRSGATEGGFEGVGDEVGVAG